MSPPTKREKLQMEWDGYGDKENCHRREARHNHDKNDIDDGKRDTKYEKS